MRDVENEKEPENGRKNGEKSENGVIRWLKSTSNRSFILYPLLIIVFEWVVIADGNLAAIRITPGWALLMIWGYGQFKLTGAYRTRRAGGGPGLAVPPDQILSSGPYRYTRNPMYLGHLIFMAGLALTFHSQAGALLLAFHIIWFHKRVRGDEKNLERIFGNKYRDYKNRVKRWIPGVI